MSLKTPSDSICTLRKALIALYSLTLLHKNKIKRPIKSLEGTANAEMEEERREMEKRGPNCEG